MNKQQILKSLAALCLFCVQTPRTMAMDVCFYGQVTDIQGHGQFFSASVGDPFWGTFALDGTELRADFSLGSEINRYLETGSTRQSTIVNWTISDAKSTYYATGESNQSDIWAGMSITGPGWPTLQQLMLSGDAAVASGSFSVLDAIGSDNLHVLGTIDHLSVDHRLSAVTERFPTGSVLALGILPLFLFHFFQRRMSPVKELHDR